jgi:hypothetical protein
MSLLKIEKRGPGVKALSFAGDSPGIGYDHMIVLEWMEEQQSTELVRDDQGGFKPGEPLFWKPRGEKGVTTKSTGPDGKALKPVKTQPILVWVPGPTGKGLIDPNVEGDFGVRVMWVGEYTNLATKLGVAMLAGGRTDGILQIGDDISVRWTRWDGPRKDYTAGFIASTEQTVTLATKAKAKFDAWQESRQREAEDRPSTLAAGNGGAPSYDPPSGGEDPRGWSAGSEPAKTPEPAAVGGGLFDDAPF